MAQDNPDTRSIHERLIAINEEIGKLMAIAPPKSFARNNLRYMRVLLPKIMESWAATDPDFITDGL